MKYVKVSFHVSDTYSVGDKIYRHNMTTLSQRCRDYLMNQLSDVNGGYVTESNQYLSYPGTTESVRVFSAIIPELMADDDSLLIFCKALKQISKNESIVTEVIRLEKCLL